MTAAQHALVLAHLDLPQRVAGSFVGRGLPRCIERDDLVSEGNVGLLEAALRFNVDLGIPFRAYAIRRVWGRVMDYLRSFDTLTRDERKAIRTAGQRRSGDLQQLTTATDAIDTRIPHVLDRMIAREELHRRLVRLPKRHLRVMRYYFVDGLRLKAIGRRYGVTESSISYMRTHALNVFRQAP